MYDPFLTLVLVAGEKQLILVRMGEKDHDHRPKNYPVKGPMPLRARDNIRHRKARSADVHLQVLGMLSQRLGDARRRDLQRLPYFDVLPVMFSALMKHPTWKPTIKSTSRKDMINSEDKLATRADMLRATEMPHLLGAIEGHLRRQTRQALVDISDELERSRASLDTIVDGTLQGQDKDTLDVHLPERLKDYVGQTEIVVANDVQIPAADEELTQVMQAVDKVFGLQDSPQFSGPCLLPIDDQVNLAQEEVGRLIQNDGFKHASASLRKAVKGSKNVYVDGVAEYLHSRLWALEDADSGSGTGASKVKGIHRHAHFGCCIADAPGFLLDAPCAFVFRIC